MEHAYQRGESRLQSGKSRYEGEGPLPVLQPRQSWLYRLTVKLDEIAFGVVFWLALAIVCFVVAMVRIRLHEPTKLELARMHYQSEGLVGLGEGVCERPYWIAPYTNCYISFDGEPPHEWTCTAHGCFHQPE